MSAHFSAAEQSFMERALQLARRGLGRVEPNPMVGCLLVKRGRVVGEGYHRRYGGPHAEVEALRQAGPHARGATAYVTLEPCCHYGKTPPCTEALIAARIARVVVAMRDPFPAVNGGGVRRLRAAGITVDTGLLEPKALSLNAPFVTLVTQARPYTILKWAQSLDGRIATRTGDSQWISSPAARHVVHQLRARMDGVLVGIGTVLADDPQLTARNVPVRRTATRLVLDSRLRIPLTAGLVTTARSTPTVVLTTRAAQRRHGAKADRLRRAGVEVVFCRSRGDRVDLRAVLGLLAERRLTNLLVEGGGAVLTAFLAQQLADEALVFVSPRLIGGEQAVSPFGGLGAARMSMAPLFGHVRIRRISTDLLYRVHFGDGGPSSWLVADSK